MTDIDKILAAVLGKEPDPDEGTDSNAHGAKNRKKQKKGAPERTPVREDKKENKKEKREAAAHGKTEKSAPPVKPEGKGKPARAEKNGKGEGHQKTKQKAPVAKPQGTEAGKAAKKQMDAVPKNAKKKTAGETAVGAAKQDKAGAKRSRGSVRVIPLGGLEEIGKNITLIETDEDIILVDCGMGFPDEDMFGVDLVIPDFTYLERNKAKLRGVFLTHGHEDHIGGVPYLLRQIHMPVYGTRLTLGILEKKLEEIRPERKPDLRRVEAGDTVRAGGLTVEFIHVNHSIADSCALAIDTPAGKILHSGDFKLDVSPIDGQMMDVTRLGELGREGVELLLCESTNAERSGFTPSERVVGSSLEQIFLTNRDKRLVIATFSSNVHRVQQIINASVRYGRRVAVLGRSMVTVIGAAAELGYIDLPEGTLIDISEIKRFKPEQLTLITTGSQGEPMSALYRMAFGEHDRVKLVPGGDLVVLSASAIPGNEKLVGKIVNALVKSGISVINDNNMHVHVSGHACGDELKLMHALTKPKYFMPIHGESRHLHAHKQLAEYMGMPPSHIFVSEIGKVLELKDGKAAFAGTVPAGRVLVDGSGVGDVRAVVLRDRKSLAEEGLIVAVASVDTMSGQLISGPDLVSRGFVYVKESGDLMEEARAVTRQSLEYALGRGVTDHMELKSIASAELSKFLFKMTKRRPMVLVVVNKL